MICCTSCCFVCPHFAFFKLKKKMQRQGRSGECSEFTAARAACCHKAAPQNLGKAESWCCGRWLLPVNAFQRTSSSQCCSSKSGLHCLLESRHSSCPDQLTWFVFLFVCLLHFFVFMFACLYSGAPSLLLHHLTLHPSTPWFP